jgi:ribonuclease Z
LPKSNNPYYTLPVSLEVFSLGTSGMMPLPGRFLTSALVRREGELFLFDCGEGTQVSLKMLNLKWKKISSIFISHMHADHVTGLPGLLMLSSQVERSEPLYIYGPAKLGEFIEASRRILDMYINYEIRFIPVEEGLVTESGEYSIYAYRLRHTKPCFGYSLVEKTRPGEFSVEKALAMGVPRGPKWGQLQRGGEVENEEGRIIKPSDVLGPARSGRKFCYITDTKYFPEIADFVHDADFALIEGMFCRDLEADAEDKMHMTSTQAAMIARDGNVKKMGLQHYSPRYSDYELRQLKAEAAEIFPGTILTRDRMSFDIPNAD